MAAIDSRSFVDQLRGHHVTCVLIGTSRKLAGYNYTNSLVLWMMLECQLVDANRVCQCIQKVRVEPATRSAWTTRRLIVLSFHTDKRSLSTFTFQWCSSCSHNTLNTLPYTIYRYVEVSVLNCNALCCITISLHIEILWQFYSVDTLASESQYWQPHQVGMLIPVTWLIRPELQGLYRNLVTVFVKHTNWICSVPSCMPGVGPERTG